MRKNVPEIKSDIEAHDLWFWLTSYEYGLIRSITGAKNPCFLGMF